MKYIKQYGLKRSGTNYLTALLYKNFRDIHVFINVLGWKHKKDNFKISFKRKDWYKDYNPSKQEVNKNVLNDVKKSNIYYIFQLKNPYNWVVSLAKYQNRPIKSFSINYIRSLTIRWNIKVNNYLEFTRQNIDISTVIRYEDLPQILSFIGTKFNLTKKYKNCIYDIEKRVGAGNDSSKIILQDSKINKNKVNLYHEKLSTKQIKVITNTVDYSLMTFFNYKDI
jgi:hypothetical protein